MNTYFPDKVVNIKVGRDDITIDVRKELEINEEDLNRELCEQPGKYAYFATLCCELEQELRLAEFTLEQVYAQKDAAIRSEYTKNGEKITEKSIENKIRVSEEYILAWEETLRALKNRDIVRAIRDALSQRKDTMISVASNKRVERESELSFKKQQL